MSALGRPSSPRSVPAGDRRTRRRGGRGGAGRGGGARAVARSSSRSASSARPARRRRRSPSRPSSACRRRAGRGRGARRAPSPRRGTGRGRAGRAVPVAAVAPVAVAGAVVAAPVADVRPWHPSPMSTRLPSWRRSRRPGTPSSMGRRRRRDARRCGLAPRRGLSGLRDRRRRDHRRRGARCVAGSRVQVGDAVGLRVDHLRGRAGAARRRRPRGRDRRPAPSRCARSAR